MHVLSLHHWSGGIAVGQKEPLRQSAGLAGGRFLWIVATALTIVCSASPAHTQQGPVEKQCQTYSDRFDSYNAERWHEVLLYSRTQGTVAVENGRLILRTSPKEPVEVEVYSLFCVEGDFDIQVEYDLSDPGGVPSCRFNVGMVLQTPGDENSYKCYFAAAQKEDFLYRSRLDAFGENNLEKHKGPTAPETGTIRMVRKAGAISCLVLDADRWRTVYTFSKSCHEKLRVRFKVQTSGEDAGTQPCPVTANFDNFTVNSCDRIVEE